MQDKGFPWLVERSFVALVAERAIKRGFKHSRFAALVWPTMSPNAANVRWSAIRRHASNTGRPQGLQLSDAVRMAEVLQEDLSFLLALAKDAAQTANEKLSESEEA